MIPFVLVQGGSPRDHMEEDMVIGIVHRLALGKEMCSPMEEVVFFLHLERQILMAQVAILLGLDTLDLVLLSLILMLATTLSQAEAEGTMD